MARRAVLAALAVASALGCGRVGFEERARSDATADAPEDVASSPVLAGTAAPGYGTAVKENAKLAVDAGDFLIAAAYWNEAPDTVTIADALGLTWQPLPSEVITGSANCGDNTGNATGAQLFAAAAGAGGSDEITVAQTSGTQPLGVILLDYRGIAGVATSTSTVAPASSTAMTAPAIATTVPGIVVAFFGDTIGMGALTAGSGFTAEARDPGFPNMIEDAIVEPGTYTATATLPNGPDRCWVAIVVALRAR